MDNSKLRTVGIIISSLSVVYYLFEIIKQILNWYSYETVSELTACTEVYGLEVWLLSQSIIWCTSLTLMLVIFIHPNSFKLMLCFFYLVGPLFLIWTVFALFTQIFFISCCTEEADKCVNFYPFSHSANFTMLLVISLLFSISASILLISLLITAFWQYFRNSLLRYQNLI